MHQEIVSIRISHQELLRKMLIFSQVFFFSQPEFLSVFKLANIPLVFKKTENNSIEKTIDQSAYFETSK